MGAVKATIGHTLRGGFSQGVDLGIHAKEYITSINILMKMEGLCVLLLSYILSPKIWILLEKRGHFWKVGDILAGLHNFKGLFVGEDLV